MRRTNLHCFGGWEGQGLACSSCCCHFGSRAILRVIFERIVHMEPTPVEMQSFTTVESVFLWAQLKGETLQKLLYILGVEDDDHPRVLAAVSETDWDEAISKWSALANPASPALKAKAVVAKGAAVLKTTGLRVGEQAPVCSIVPSMSAGSGLGKFNFNTVTNQSSEVVMSVLEAGELKVAYDNYRAVFGVVPPVEEELTVCCLGAARKSYDAKTQVAGLDILFTWVNHSH